MLTVCRLDYILIQIIILTIIIESMILTTFTIIELATASVAVLGALGMCLTRVIGQAEQSRCSKISCCCLKCDRQPHDEFTDLSQSAPTSLEITERKEGNTDFDEALNSVPRK